MWCTKNQSALALDLEKASCYAGGVEEREQDSNPEPLFDLGQVVATPGALQALQDVEQDPAELLRRHVSGDWGDLGEEDKEENELSIENGYRIFSAYELNAGVKVWLITEADRSATTFLLPDEY